ncbi:MAG: hypothetical protein K6T61_15265 [Bryobacteraceae bacterium]|nr:hypothetical protein [Bryobacteraceae bacterium]
MKGLRSAQFLLAFGFAATAAAAQPSELCIEDRVRLDAAVAASFQREFQILLPSWEFVSCGQQAVRVIFRFDPPARYGAALGLAWFAQDRVLPVVEVYLNPVLRTLGPARSAEIVGRALARVAAHEVAHYALQRLDHDSSGLLHPRFASVQLAGKDPTSFLLSQQ